MFYLTITICAADDIKALITFSYPLINYLLRPVVCIIFFSQLRSNLKSVALDLKDSIVVLFCIFAYIMYFAAVGMFIFDGTQTGFTSFSSLGDSFYSLIILITTSNFPDIMLYAYAESTVYVLFFVIFVLFGVFFLLNLLLGVIFDNYKRRIEELRLAKGTERLQYIKQFFDQFDAGEKGYLTAREARRFFSQVLDLNYKIKEDRSKFKTMMHVLDPLNEGVVYEDRMLEFFKVGGFLHLRELEEE